MLLPVRQTLVSYQTEARLHFAIEYPIKIYNIVESMANFKTQLTNLKFQREIHVHN